MNADARRTALVLTIANGAGHTTTALAIAEALEAERPDLTARVVDVSDFMTPVARFTHVTLYLFLVTKTPRLWGLIDRYQSRQPTTSPEWFYHRSCAALFRLARELRPVALVATEVGCCEIAALIKRDLELNIPLVAASPEYSGDRAWVRPEVDHYAASSESARALLVEAGAPEARVEVHGVALAEAFEELPTREVARESVCAWLGLDASRPVVLVSGGGTGMGPIERVAAALADLSCRPQVVVAVGRNRALAARCRKLAASRDALRVLEWTDRMPELMRAADVQVSKLGNAFDEALAAEVPLVVLEPPPGGERLQYALLEPWGVGIPAPNVDVLAAEVERLLLDDDARAAMRASARARRKPHAARSVARRVLAEMAARAARPLEVVS